MWYLVEGGGSRKIPLLPDKEYLIGRKECDIVLEPDKSVSRRHASVTITKTSTDEFAAFNHHVMTITDLSKFGTFVNDQLLNNTCRKLAVGDVLRFAQCQTVMRVVYEATVVTTSCLDSAAKRAVQTDVHALGGRLVKDWEPGLTSHLVMGRITVTPKTVCCLIQQRPIVTPEYFTEFLKACRNHTELPSVELFSPEVSDSQVNPLMVSFKPNPLRANIFCGKKFIFLHKKEFLLLSRVIELGGGACLLMASQPADLSQLTSPGVVVVYVDERDTSLPHETRCWVVEARKYMKRFNKRLIQEAEIGYAVLNASTDYYCNPEQAAGRQLFINMSQSATSTQQPLAADTQQMLPEIPPLKQRRILLEKSLSTATTIPNSVTSDAAEGHANMSHISKEPLCDSEAKRPHIGDADFDCTRLLSNMASEFVGHHTVPPQGLTAASLPAASLSACRTTGVSSMCRDDAGSDRPSSTHRASEPLLGAKSNQGIPMSQDVSNPRTTSDVQSGPCGAVLNKSSLTVTSSTASAAHKDNPVVAAALQDKEPTRPTADVHALLSAGLVLSTVCVKRESPASLVDLPCESVHMRLPSAPVNVYQKSLVSVKQEPIHPEQHGWRGRHSAVMDSVMSEPVGDRLTPACTITLPEASIREVASNTSVGSTVSGADPALEIRCVNVQLETLVRAPKRATAAAGDQINSAGMTLWNGKWMKNFKRFVKHGQRQLHHLPRIIGGSDLVDSASLSGAKQRNLDRFEVHAYGHRKRPAVPSNAKSATTLGRGLLVDSEDEMELSSHQTRINAIFDGFTG